jgi:hypothetical protein
MIMSYFKRQSKSIPVFLFSIFYFLFSIFSCSAASSDGFSLTITPPLFQLSVSPGESWSSTIKVVNNNSYDIDIYASAMDFEVKDETGVGRFIPSTKTTTTSYSLATWLSVPKEPIHIPAEKTGVVPFTLIVPENAEPGGHYGAILTGNQPNAISSGNTVNVSAAISSLFLVKVNGEMIEKGDIREFSLDRDFYQEPKVKFTLRFENKGNVHLLPRGEIEIRNMWGKSRGKIHVNQDSDFGNVLPKSIRKFSFEWSGEDNFYEIGRYTALATLAFGDQTKETVYRETSFWVVPLVPLFKILAFFFVFIGFFVWSIRRYIRRALALEAERMTTVTVPETLKVETLVRPITLGVVDLRSAVSKTPLAVAGGKGKQAKEQEKMTLSKFVRKYRIFLICVVCILIGIYGIRSYFKQVLTYQRDYNVKVQREDGATVKTSSKTQIKTNDVNLGN